MADLEFDSANHRWVYMGTDVAPDLTNEWIRERLGWVLYLSPHVPNGMAYLMQGLEPQFDHQRQAIRWRIDPWGQNRYVEPGIEDERRKGLNFIAHLLDQMCESYGWDPDEVWRGPKERENNLRMRSWVAQERIALGIIHDPSAFVAVEGI